MKGQSYKTPEGEIVTVKDFDAANKIAYVHIQSGQYKWYTEEEYSTWVSTGTAAPKPEYFYVPDMPAQMTDEQEKSVVKEIEQPVVETELVETDVVENPKKKITKKKA